MLLNIIIGLFIIMLISPISFFTYRKMEAQKSYHYHLVKFLEKQANNGVKYSNLFLVIPERERERIEKNVEADIRENGLTESTILIYRISLDRAIAKREKMAKELVNELNKEKALKNTKKSKNT